MYPSQLAVGKTTMNEPGSAVTPRAWTAIREQTRMEESWTHTDSRATLASCAVAEPATSIVSEFDELWPYQRHTNFATARVKLTLEL